MLKPNNNLLVIRLSAMGDVAMTIPVLRALIQNYPDLKITVLTRSFFAPFFRDLPNTTVFAAEVKGKHKGILGLYKLAHELNENKFYGIADLHNVLRSKILINFIKCNHLSVIDKGRSEKKLLTSGERFSALKTTHQRYADVFNALGYKIDLSKPSFPGPSVLNNELQRLLGLSSKKSIGIAPIAAYEGKMYPLDLMKQVVEVLSQDYNVLLFGGAEDVEVLDTFNNTTNIAGKLELDEELDVISNLDLMISMDSGNAHVAAMLGIKVVTIWGVTHPFGGFAPFNQPEDYALLANRKKFPLIPTSIYGNKYPVDYKEAAGSIPPKFIIEKVRSII